MQSSHKSLHRSREHLSKDSACVREQAVLIFGKEGSHKGPEVSKRKQRGQHDWGGMSEGKVVGAEVKEVGVRNS